MGPLGEMGLPGPNGLKVHLHLWEALPSLALFCLDCLIVRLQEFGGVCCSFQCVLTRVNVDRVLFRGLRLTHRSLFVPGGARKSRRSRTER